MPAGWYGLLLGLRVAAFSAAAALLVSAWPGWAMATRDFRWKRSLLAVAAFLALVPSLIFGYLLLPRLTWQVAVAASLVQAAPFVLRAARDAFAALPRDYRNSARVMGASDWLIFWRIGLPLAYRPVLAAAVAVFVFTLLQSLATLLIEQRLRGPA